MKIIIILLLFLTLLGCDSPEELPVQPPSEMKMNMPEALKDCKTYLVHSEEGYSPLVITRCPNSSTTTFSGKSGNVIAIEEAPEEEEK